LNKNIGLGNYFSEHPYSPNNLYILKWKCIEFTSGIIILNN
jgi:hypothetical protein